MSFDAFWTIYPRRVGKFAARKAWDKAVRDGANPDEILAAAKTFAAQRQGQDPQYTPHPSTWLNQGRWLDEGPPEFNPEQYRNQLAADAQARAEAQAWRENLMNKKRTH